MRLGYLVLAHHQFGHLQRLLSVLAATPDSRIFVHLDAKSTLPADFSPPHVGVEFIGKRVSVHWGEFSQVEALLALMRAGLASRPEIDRFVLLSGADYPLRSMSYVREFFARHDGVEFIEADPMPNERLGKPLSRLTEYRHQSTDGPLRRAWHDWRLRARLIPSQRDIARGMPGVHPHAGATWWALTRQAMVDVLDFIDRRPDVVDFYRHSLCPDESLIHTALAHGRDPGQFRPSLTWADWRAGGPSPAVLSPGHLPRLRSECFDASVVDRGGREWLFARKFVDASSDITSMLDLEIQCLASGS